MNHIKFASAIVTALLIVVMLAWGQGSTEVEGTGQAIRPSSGGQFPASANPASAPVRDAADSGDVDVLEMLGNPSIKRSPLSVHQKRAIQARGTAVPLQLDVEQYKRIRFEHHLQLDEFPLPATQRGEAVRSVTLHLERLPVLTDETVFVLGDANAPDGIGEQLPTPDMAMYRGTVEGEPESRIFLSLAAETAYGYIRSENQTHLISPGPHGEQRDLLIYNLTAMPAGAIPWRDFVCSTPPKFVDLTDIDEAPPMATSEELPCRRIQLAIETDKEFTDNLFGGDMTAASIYAATMIGAASEIFLNDLNSYFELSFIRLWTGEDIWTGVNTFAQLFEFQQEWQDNMSHVQRDLAHYLSGRALGGGVAWLNAVCHSTNGYALSANLSGHFPYPLQDNHTQNWDIVVFTHELGHNVGAPHTHDVCPPVDQCAPESFHGQCQDETVCISNGTIMGYCHTCPGGLSNVILEFHPTIRDIMLNFLANVDGPSCPLSTGTTTCTFTEGCEWVDLDGGMNNAVWAIGEYHDDLIVGGDFTNAGGQTMQRIALWDGQWNNIGAANNTVRALAEYDGEMVAGGLFTVIGGQSVGRIARWNGSQWAPLGAGLSGGSNPRVFDLKVFDGDLYASGTFLNSGQLEVNRIARWDGNEWHALGTGMNSNVYALAVYNGQLHAAGSFTEAGGVTAHRIARWDGSAWHPVGGGFNDIVFALAVYDGDLIAGGLFTSAGGNSASRVARWDGSTWQALDTGVNDLVQTMTVHNDSLYIGGGFAVAGNVVSSRLARWDGEEWNAAAIGVNNVVRAIMPYQGGLAVGGSFTLVSGQPINRIALVDCSDDEECHFADINCDGFVDGQDLLILLAAWGQCPDPDNCPADLNQDGFVDGQDLLLLLANWG